MALCEQCGSIQIVRAHSTGVDKAVKLLTARQPFLCRRCGWRARRPWTHADLVVLANYGRAGASVDTAFRTLDDGPAVSPPAGGPVPQDLDEFDLSTLDLSVPRAGDGPGPHTAVPSAVVIHLKRRHRRTRNRPQRSRRREVVGAIAISALAVFAFLSLAFGVG